MFVIVHFTERDEVEIVPGSWVKGTVCRWPKIPSHKARKMITKGAPIAGPFETYHITVKGVFGTYEEANEKLDVIQYTSDINTDSGTDAGKRKRYPPQYLEDTVAFTTQRKRRQPQPMPALSDSDPDEVIVSSIPDNLAQCNTAKKRQQSQPLPDTSDSDPDEVGMPSVPDNFPQCNTARKAKADAPSQGSSCMATQRQYCSTTEGAGEMHTGIQGTQQPKTAMDQDGSTFNKVKTEFQKQVLRLLHVVRFTLQQHSDVLQAICNQGVNNAVGQTAPNFLVKAAFATSEALEEFSKSLNEERQAQLVDEFSHLGGTDVRHATRSILSYLLTDTVAREYSWLGQKGKRKFSMLKFPPLIFQAVRRDKKLATATKSEVEGAIKSWLRHANERCKSKEAESEG
ncbi:uncharacterized protein LOC135391255 isoform X1 [Ornithodoros turicata]|uniref:uncharacterized protein LOC135391255 isoform X1 n=1 Tax=Ornithodoros turicata TaxID=34597 RepID=UPI0031393766